MKIPEKIYCYDLRSYEMYLNKIWYFTNFSGYHYKFSTPKKEYTTEISSEEMEILLTNNFWLEPNLSRSVELCWLHSINPLSIEELEIFKQMVNIN